MPTGRSPGDAVPASEDSDVGCSTAETGNVIPFARPALTTPQPGTQTRGRQLAAEQNGPDRDAYARASAAQRDERLLATGRIVPARISLALDAIGAEGHWVDRALGGQHPDVDRWEAGLAVPSAEQVRLLATMTERPIAWFYEPLPAGPIAPTGMFVCFRGAGKKNSGYLPPDVITEDGILLPCGEPRPPIDAVVQDPLFEDEPEPERAPRPRPARPAASRTAAAIPVVSPRMPAHLRAELDATLARRRERR